jgi:hypothetical protein
MEIIKERQHHQSTKHFLFFEGENGCGFSFDCDKFGKVDQDKLSDAAKSNYDDCIVNGDGSVEESVQNWIEPAIGLCLCGGRVELEGFTNTCESCGKDYNSSGQQLAPREQWGEETGEHPADIARIR